MNVLAHPYPESGSKKEVLFSSAIAGFSVYAFLLVFQPFGTNTIATPVLIRVLFPYFLIVSAVFYSVNAAVSGQTGRSNWGREVLKATVAVLVCAVLCYFYNALVLSKVKLSFLNFFFMMAYVFSVAVPVCSLYLMGRFIYLRPDQEEDTGERIGYPTFSGTGSCSAAEGGRIQIGDFVVKVDDLVYVESSDNYCTFHCQSGSELKKVLVRTTLKSILEQTKSPVIARCHRSYIVNLQKVKQVKGNAQGYRVYLGDSDFAVPVSRKYAGVLKSLPDTGRLA